MLDMLDVAIGVTFYFLLFSLITTAAGEVVEAFWKQRAKFLQRAIQGLLQDDEGKKVAVWFYQHPLIRALYAGKPRWSEANDAALATSGIQGAKSVDDLTRKPTYIPSDTFAKALLGLLREKAEEKAQAAGGAAAPLTLPAILDALSTDPLYAALVRALRPLLNGVEDDVEAALKRIEEWYDAAMDRASGWYKRHAQAVAFVFGLGVAVFMNADTLYTVQALSREDGLRAAFVAAAADAVEEAATARAEEAAAQEEAAEEEAEIVEENPEPQDTSESGTGPAPPSTTANEPDALQEARARLDANVARLEELGLPLGWRDDNPGARWPPRAPGTAPLAWYESAREHPGWWFRKLLGLLLTAVAVTLGAPFWFDVLNKFMVVRSTVKPKEKSPEEGSED